MARRVKWNDEQLRAAVASSTSYVRVLRALGQQPSGGSHYAIRRRVRELGLDTGHFVLSADHGWDDDRLRDAVASSSSFDMVVDRLGAEPSPDVYERLQRRVTMLGIDRSHFARPPRRPPSPKPRSWTDDELRAAVAGAKSYAGAIRALGLIPAGGNYNHIQRRIRELALDLSHFTGQGWNVGWRFDPRPHRPLDEVLVSGRGTSSHSLKQRLFRAGIKRPACELCGWNQEAPDGRIPVELDHINGDKNDNRLENLRILCPNCRALQPTHRGLNKQSARRRKA